MPTTLLSIGPPNDLVQNTVYALPAVKVDLYTDATTPTIVQSGTVAMSATTTVTVTAGVATGLVGGFIKCTSGAITVRLKRA